MSPITIVPFAAAHLDAAAALLASRHARGRENLAALPGAFTGASVTRPVLEALLTSPDVNGVAALDADGLAGYLLGGVGLPSPTMRYAGMVRPRFGRINYTDHAVRAGMELPVYRALYAALAPDWLRQGLYAHYIDVPATDTAVLAAWFSLGFGQDLALAVRDTGPIHSISEAASGIAIHQAGPEDIGVILPLVEALDRHHASSPMFLPALTETKAESRTHQEALLTDHEAAHWVAYRDGAAVGMQTFHSPTVAEITRPERAIYLYQGVTLPDARGGGVGAALLGHSLTWAREAGHEWCLLHYFTANLSGARFWTGQGFQPLSLRLHRQVDERIAWARGE